MFLKYLSLPSPQSRGEEAKEQQKADKAMSVGMFLKYLFLPGAQSRVRKPKNNTWQTMPCLQVCSWSA